MIFEILRISIDGAVDNHGILLEGEITRPCEEAFKEEVPNWHIISYTEEKYNKIQLNERGSLWKETGTNHQITTEGYIKRQEGMRSCWLINIDSIDQLVNLSKKYGQLLIQEFEITIYDEYIG